MTKLVNSITYGGSMRIFQYASERATKLYFASWAVLAISTLVLFLTDSTFLFLLGVALGSLMNIPLLQDLLPVAWQVSIHGRWPQVKLTERF